MGRIPTSLFRVLPILAMASFAAFAQGKPAVVLASGVPSAAARSLPVPKGYVDAMEPASAGTEFYEDLKRDWEHRDYTPNGLVAVWVEQAVLERYFQGGPNPLDSHYCYVCRVENVDFQGEIENFKNHLKQNPPLIANPDLNKLKPGQPQDLGLVKETGQGMIFGFVVAVDRIGSKRIRAYLTAAVTGTKGGYILNDVSAIDGNDGLSGSIARLEALAGGVEQATKPSS